MNKEEELIEIVLSANKIFKYMHVEPYMESSKISFRNQTQFLDQLEDFYEKLGEFNVKYNII